MRFDIHKVDRLFLGALFYLDLFKAHELVPLFKALLSGNGRLERNIVVSTFYLGMLVHRLGYADDLDALGAFVAQLLCDLLVIELFGQRKVHYFYPAVSAERQSQRKHYINVRIESLRVPHRQL